MDVSETPLLYCNFICSMQPKKEKPGWLTLELLLVSGLFVAALLLFAFLANEVVLGKKDLFDTAVFRFFEPFATPALLNFAKASRFLVLRTSFCRPTACWCFTFYTDASGRMHWILLWWASAAPCCCVC
jgi:hypothetical protein